MILEAKDFRCFPELRLEMKEGLTLVDGVNLDLGRSIMSGKSTAFDLAAWIRYGWLPRWGGPKGGRSDAVIRRKADSCWGRSTERIGSDEIVIERHRPHRLIVWKNGVELKGMDQKGLEELLGMSADRYLVACYIAQRTRRSHSRSFFAMSDVERMDLLSIVAGLDSIDRSLESVRRKKEELDQSLAQHLGLLVGYEDTLKRATPRINELETEMGVFASRLADLEVEADAARHKLAEEKLRVAKDRAILVEAKKSELLKSLGDQIQKIDRISAELSEQEEKMRSVPSLDTSGEESVRKIELELLEMHSKISVLEDVKRSNVWVKKEADRHSSLAAVALEGKCDACGQVLPEERRSAEFGRQSALAEVALAKIQAEAPIDRSTIPALQEKLNAARDDSAKKRAERSFSVDRLKSELKVLAAGLREAESEKARISSLLSQLDAAIERSAMDALRPFEDRLSRADGAFAMERSRKEFLSRSIEDLRHAAVETEALIARVSTDASSLRDQISETEDLIDLFGPKGFRSVCFDGLIDRIGDRAAQLLSLMSDGVYATRLVQVKEDAKGNAKIALRPLILKDGQEVPLDDLSGGAEDQIGIAYDIAISDVAGAGLPLFLDETLASLDPQTKQEILGVLEEVAKTRPVLLIDHSSETKAAISQVMKIVHENGESRLEVE